MDEEVLKGYVIGFFDGEGSVAIPKGYSSHWRHPQYKLQVTVTSSGLPALMRFCDSFEGHVHISGRPGVDERGVARRRPTYQWTLHGAKASNFLQQILPYLVGKKRQAEVGIKFQETIRGKPVSEDIWKLREELYREMKMLNLEGKGRGRRRIPRRRRKRSG